MTTDERLLVGISEACRLLSLGRTSVYQLMDAGDLQNIKVGKRRLIKMDSINEFIERLSTEAA
ncbi:MAG: helix-turn-helix domain-containing protein [Proteobacteria bacterium]|nr:helix-turn-helix domain-containing protein [Pseudomonadota bacterium]